MFKQVQRQNSISAEEVAKFPCLFPNLSWLTSGRTSGQKKLVLTLPWIERENYLMMAKSLNVGYLPYAVGKQLSIPLINLGRK